MKTSKKLNKGVISKLSNKKGIYMLSRLLKFLAYSLFFIVILIILLPTLLSIRSVNKFLLKEISYRVDKSIEADSMKFSWMNGIDLNGVRIKSKKDNLSVYLPYVHAKFSIKYRVPISELTIENGKINLQDPKSAAIQLDKLSVKIYPKNDDHFICKAKGEVITGSQKGNFRIDCDLKDLITKTQEPIWNEEKLSLNYGAIKAFVHIENFPTIVFKKLSLFDELSIVGPFLNADLNLNASKGENGELSLKVTSKQLNCEVLAEVRDHKLLLKKPLSCKLFLTEEGRKLLFDDPTDFLNSGIVGDLPVNLWVDNKGFLLPLSPLDPNKLEISNMKLDIGKIKLKKQGFCDIIVGLFTPFSRDGAIDFESTPLYLSVKNGIINCERADGLLANSFHLAWWGKIYFIEDKLNMIIAIQNSTLDSITRFIPYTSDSFLQIPLTGTLENPKLDSNVIAIKLATLSQKLNILKTGFGLSSLFGGMYDIAIDKLLQQEPTPKPTTQPFPWKKGK